MSNWRGCWKWADAGLADTSDHSLTALGLRLAATFNPLRWSSWKTLPQLKEELQGYLGEAHTHRPVMVIFRPTRVVDVATLDPHKYGRTFGSPADAVAKLEEGPVGAGPSPLYNPSYTFQAKPANDTIICPGLRVMYNCGLLKVDPAGRVTREDLIAAQQAAGMLSPLMNVEATEGSKAGTNVFALQDDPRQGHRRALKLCIPTPAPSKWDEVASFARDGVFGVDEFGALLAHVQETRQEDPSPHKADALVGVLATLLQMIGTPDAARNGSLTISEPTLRRFWMEGIPPVGADGRWHPNTTKIVKSVELIDELNRVASSHARPSRQ